MERSKSIPIMSKNVYLIQPQYASQVENKQFYWIPYSVGALWAYVNQFDYIQKTFTLKEIIFRREDPISIINRLDNPYICGFSCHPWNKNYCLNLAEQIKKRYPSCVIVFGGSLSNTNLLEVKFIDNIIIGEGEESFLDLLQKIKDNQTLPRLYQKKRLLNLDIPSPYTQGVFDNIIKENPNTIWSTVLETNRGCPHPCNFCDWGGTTSSKVKKFNLDRVIEDIKWIAEKPIQYIYCSDANFGIYKERDLNIAQQMNDILDHSKVDYINLQYTKDTNLNCLQIAKVLKKYNTLMTINVESMNEPTLKNIKRNNLSSSKLKELFKLTEFLDIPTCTELILGLPHESLSTWKNGIDTLLNVGQHNNIDVFFAQAYEQTDFEKNMKSFNITTIKANDHISTNDTLNWQDFRESISIVCSTDKMTKDDIIEAYMYSWLITHFHMSGYSQIYSRYLNTFKEVSYRTFYDLVYENISLHPELGKHFTVVKENVNSYLSNQSFQNDYLINGYYGHTLHLSSYGTLYKMKKYIFEFAYNIASQLSAIPQDIKLIQESFVFCHNNSNVKVLETNFNILEKEVGLYTCKIEPKISNIHSVNLNNYRMRRKGLFKNKLTFLKKTL